MNAGRQAVHQLAKLVTFAGAGEGPALVGGVHGRYQTDIQKMTPPRALSCPGAAINQPMGREGVGVGSGRESDAVAKPKPSLVQELEALA
jgi:hypothetical protein